MFCHLTLQSRPAAKREPEVDLTSSQSSLSSSVLLVKCVRVCLCVCWGADSQSETWAQLILPVPAFICLLRRLFSFFLFLRNSRSGALSPGKTEEWHWLGQVDAFS